MEHEQPQFSLPIVEFDDMLGMMGFTSRQQWDEFAKNQPELATEVEQQANTLRKKIEGGQNPLETVREAIAIVTFVSNAISRRYKRQHETMENPGASPSTASA